MSAKNINFEALRTLIKKRELDPVYILHGEEGYFIDVLVKEFENILPDDEKEFNLSVLYAPRTDLATLPEICRRVPMFSDFQVVILKEVQEIGARELNTLTKYISNPSDTTVLVIASRGESLKGEFLTAAKKQNSVTVFETVKIYEDKLPGFIKQFINDKGLNVEPRSLSLLTEYIGADLSRLYNEIDKLTDILGPGATVTPESIEKHIGYSKSYNIYELVDALSVKDAKKAFRTLNYFRPNEKKVSVVQISASLFNYFSDLLTTYFAKDKSDKALMAMLGIKWPVQFKRFAEGRKHYDAFNVIEIIRAIRAFDRMSKGNGSRRDKNDLLFELVYHILNPRRELFPKF